MIRYTPRRPGSPWLRHRALGRALTRHRTDQEPGV